MTTHQASLSELYDAPKPPPRPRTPKPKLPGEDDRDRGRDQVHAHNETFADRVIRIIPALSLPATFIGEDIRVQAVTALEEEPKHPNAWGAIITRALREGLIEEVTDAPLRKMRARRSHARRSPVYRLTPTPEGPTP